LFEWKTDLACHSCVWSFFGLLDMNALVLLYCGGEMTQRGH